MPQTAVTTELENHVCVCEFIHYVCASCIFKDIEIILHKKQDRKSWEITSGMKARRCRLFVISDSFYVFRLGLFHMNVYLF